MKKIKILIKTILVAIFTFASFAGMFFEMPQSANEVLADDSITPTAMSVKGLNYYPVFDSNNKLPAGVDLYTKSGSIYIKMTDFSIMKSVDLNAEGGTLYYTNKGDTPIKCFAVKEISWNNLFDSQSAENNVAQNLRTGDGSLADYMDTGVYTPYPNSGNWNKETENAPTINGVSIDTIKTAYSSVLGNNAFWSSRVYGAMNAYSYDCSNKVWYASNRGYGNYAILLYDFGKNLETYDVIYNLNDGVGTAPSTTTKYAVGESITLDDGTGLTKIGCTFAGWSTSSTATTGVTGSYTILSTDVVSNSITFYAVWTQSQSSGTTYTCTSSGKYSSWDVYPTEIKSGDTIKMTYDGGDCDIYLSIDGVEQMIADNNNTNKSFTATKDYSIHYETRAGDRYYIELTTKSSKYDVTYDLNKGSGTTPTETTKYEVGESITLDDGTGLTKTGYTFAGWSTSSTATTGVTGSYTILSTDVVSDKITFYAVWTAVTYNITYNLDNGTNSSSNPQTYTIETDTITLSNPTKTGYTFGGWYKESTFTTQVTSIAKGSTGDVTLYAKWTPITYNITYNLDNGTNSINNHNTYNIEDETIALFNPKKTGYSFGGWYKESTFTTQVTSIAKGSTGDVTLYAKWTPTTYTIKYELDNGINNGDNPNKYTIETATITLLDATKKGYTFGGWYKENTFATQVTSIAKGSTGDVSLYAKWNPITHTCNGITFNPLTNSFLGGELSTGNYYLYEDISLTTSSIVIESEATVNLCLNGKVLDLYENNIQNSGTLTMYDCGLNENTIGAQTYIGGVITGGKGCDVNIGSNKNNVGGAIYNRGTLSILGGNIVGNTAKLGGAIFTDKDATVTLRNCNITLNTATINGGGIYVCNQSTSINDGNCLVEGTLITMANGTSKNVEDIVTGDVIKTIDHETGLISNETVCLAYKGETKSYYFTLKFTNNKELSIVGCHDLFEQSSLKYVRISSKNANEYIGKYFYNAKSNTWEQLLGVTYSAKQVSYYSIYTAHHLNCIANEMLTCSDDVDYLLNIFELDENLKLNNTQLNVDIEKYGLLSYSEASQYMTEEYYDNFNAKYHNIAIGKGLTTHQAMLQACLNTKEYLNKVSNKVSPKKALFAAPLMALGSSNTNIYAITIGTGAKVTNNIVDNSDISNQINNIYLTENCCIKIESDATGFSAGITLEKDTGTFVTEAVNNTNLQYLTNDNSSYYTIARENEGTPKTYDYNIEEKYTVTYNSNNATSGNVPTDSSKYFNGDAITIKGNTGSLTRIGYNFLGWNTSNTATEKLDSLKMGSSNVTLYAVWEEKVDVTITETAQTYTYNGEAHSFELLGTHKDIGSFTVKYYVDGEWVATAPINADSYKVKITREEDSTYKAYVVEITSGLTISKKKLTLTWGTATFIYDEQLHLPTATIEGSQLCKSDVCNVSVTGNSSNLGYHTATATIDNNNYQLENNENQFYIIHTHGVEGESNYVVYDKELTSSFTGGELDGNYMLVDDITLLSNIVINLGKPVRLCLNGHILNLNGENSINTLSSLYIDDCNSTSCHKFSVNDNNAAILDDNGEIEIKGGIITGYFSSLTSGIINGKGEVSDANQTIVLENITVIGNYVNFIVESLNDDVIVTGLFNGRTITTNNVDFMYNNVYGMLTNSVRNLILKGGLISASYNANISNAKFIKNKIIYTNNDFSISINGGLCSAYNMSLTSTEEIENTIAGHAEDGAVDINGGLFFALNNLTSNTNKANNNTITARAVNASVVLGGLYHSNGIATYINNEANGNTITSTSECNSLRLDGGIVYNYGGKTTLTNCVFGEVNNGNSINGGWLWGGIIRSEGVIEATNSKFNYNNIESTNNTILNGGIINVYPYDSESDSTFNNCQFTNNIVKGSSDIVGGVIYAYKSVYINNTPFIDNEFTCSEAHEFRGAIVDSEDGEVQLIDSNITNISITVTNVENVVGGLVHSYGDFVVKSTKENTPLLIKDNLLKIINNNDNGIYLAGALLQSCNNNIFQNIEITNNKIAGNSFDEIEGGLIEFSIPEGDNVIDKVSIFGNKFEIDFIEYNHSESYNHTIIEGLILDTGIINDVIINYSNTKIYNNTLSGYNPNNDSQIKVSNVDYLWGLITNPNGSLENVQIYNNSASVDLDEAVVENEPAISNFGFIVCDEQVSLKGLIKINNNTLNGNNTNLVTSEIDVTTYSKFNIEDSNLGLLNNESIIGITYSRMADKFSIPVSNLCDNMIGSGIFFVDNQRYYLYENRDNSTLCINGRIKVEPTENNNYKYEIVEINYTGEFKYQWYRKTVSSSLLLQGNTNSLLDTSHIVFGTYYCVVTCVNNSQIEFTLTSETVVIKPSIIDMPNRNNNYTINADTSKCQESNVDVSYEWYKYSINPNQLTVITDQDITRTPSATAEVLAENLPNNAVYNSEKGCFVISDNDGFCYDIDLEAGDIVSINIDYVNKSSTLPIIVIYDSNQEMFDDGQFGCSFKVPEGFEGKYTICIMIIDFMADTVIGGDVYITKVNTFAPISTDRIIELSEDELEDINKSIGGEYSTVTIDDNGVYIEGFAAFAIEMSAGESLYFTSKDGDSFTMVQAYADLDSSKIKYYNESNVSLFTAFEDGTYYIICGMYDPNTGDSINGYINIDLIGGYFMTLVENETNSDLRSRETDTYKGAVVYNDGIETLRLFTNPVNYTVRVNEPTVIGIYRYTGNEITVILDGVESYMTTTDSLIKTDVGVYTIKFTLDSKHEWADGSDGIITWEIRSLRISPKSEGESQEEKQEVIVETEDGFTSDISVVVEVVVEKEIAQKELAVDYANLEEGTKLERNEKIGVVFDVKLIQTVDGVKTEIQPSDIKPGTKIKVKMLIPSSVDISKVTRILHVHSAGDIEELAFDASKVDSNGYYEIEIDRLSEFAFIYKKGNTLLIILLCVLGVLVLLSVAFFLLNRKVIIIVDDKVYKEFRFIPLQVIDFKGEINGVELFIDKELKNAFMQQKMGFKSITLYGKKINYFDE